MIKYAIMPQEPSCQMCASGSLAGTVPVEIYANMLAARPPLDDEMLAALELARKVCIRADNARNADEGWIGADLDEADELSSALLRANGEDV